MTSPFPLGPGTIFLKCKDFFEHDQGKNARKKRIYGRRPRPTIKAWSVEDFDFEKPSQIFEMH